jgi:Domain of unknown function (DUF6458)
MGAECQEVAVGLGTSIFLIALGAILRFAVTATVSGISIQTVGTILMIVGVIGLVLSFIFWSSWGADWGYSRRRTVVDRDDTSREDRYDDRAA